MRKIFNIKRIIAGTKKIAVLGGSYFIIQKYVGSFVLCTGPSMEPTVRSKDILLTDHISPRIGNISKGDVVIAKAPTNYKNVCKRIVGVPGEYVKFKGKYIEIPENHYWLEGDNKDNSTDSRNYGPVHANLIQRRCFCKVWPYIHVRFDMVQLVDSQEPSSSSSLTSADID